MKSCDNIWKKKYPYPYLWWNLSKSIPVAMGTDIWQIWVRMTKYLPTGYPCQTLLVELISWGWYPGFKHFYREKWMIWQGCLRLVRVFLYIFRDTNLFLTVYLRQQQQQLWLWRQWLGLRCNWRTREMRAGVLRCRRCVLTMRTNSFTVMLLDAVWL